MFCNLNVLCSPRVKHRKRAGTLSGLNHWIIHEHFHCFSLAWANLPHAVWVLGMDDVFTGCISLNKISQTYQTISVLSTTLRLAQLCICWYICLLFSVYAFEKSSTFSKCCKAHIFMCLSFSLWFFFPPSPSILPIHPEAVGVWRFFSLLFICPQQDSMCNVVFCVSHRVQSVWSQNPWSTGADDEQQY